MMKMKTLELTTKKNVALASSGESALVQLKDGDAVVLLTREEVKHVVAFLDSATNDDEPEV